MRQLIDDLLDLSRIGRVTEAHQPIAVTSLVERLVSELADEGLLREDVRQRIVTQTDGIPLFVEELTKTLLEPGTAWSVEAIPASLADSLMALPVDAVVPSAYEAARTALSRRADIRSALAQKQSAERQVAATRLERFPTLGVFGDKGAIGNGTDHLLNTYQWGLQVSVPVFDGFRRDGRVQEQGTHRELLALGGYYKKLYQAQFLEEREEVVLHAANPVHVPDAVNI
jgi:hypothetical protein